MMGEATTVELPGFAHADNFERFRAKARQYLRAHEDHVAIHKLRLNKPLTATDLDELERMLATSGVGTPAELQRAREESHGLGLFVRSLVGLDREAAKGAFSGFLAGKSLSANQIEFLNLIIDHLTENGLMDVGRLYESPYTDFNPLGIDGLFAPTQVVELVSILEEVRQHAIG